MSVDVRNYFTDEGRYCFIYYFFVAFYFLFVKNCTPFLHGIKYHFYIFAVSNLLHILFLMFCRLEIICGHTAE